VSAFATSRRNDGATMTFPGSRDDWRPWVAERAGEIRTALAFATRVPFAGAAPGGEELGKALWALPLAGIAVGIVGAVVYVVAHRIGLPPWPAAALAIAATIAVTGALHEDGLADTMDGFGGGDTRERKLEIMRDSRIGTYGVCALALSILLRAGAVASLAGSGLAAAALIAAACGARAALPALMTLVAPARADGLAHDAGQPPAMHAIAAAVIGFIVAALCLGPWRAIIAAVVLVIAVFLIAQLSRRQIGGQTGDVLGAAEQAGEIIVLLVAAAG
jgi:adenosylcobinamide-GDP ribazoletransferase